MTGGGVKVGLQGEFPHLLLDSVAGVGVGFVVMGDALGYAYSDGEGGDSEEAEDHCCDGPEKRSDPARSEDQEVQEESRGTEDELREGNKYVLLYWEEVIELGWQGYTFILDRAKRVHPTRSF